MIMGVFMQWNCANYSAERIVTPFGSKQTSLRFAVLRQTNYNACSPISSASSSTGNNSKFLSDFGIRNGSRLQADDFLQDYTLSVNILHAYVPHFLNTWVNMPVYLISWSICYTNLKKKGLCMCVFIGSEELERDVEFEVIGEAPDKAPPSQANQEEVNSITNGNKESAQQSTSSEGQQKKKEFTFYLCLIQTEFFALLIKYQHINHY